MLPHPPGSQVGRACVCALGTAFALCKNVRNGVSKEKRGFTGCSCPGPRPLVWAGVENWLLGGCCHRRGTARVSARRPWGPLRVKLQARLGVGVTGGAALAPAPPTSFWLSKCPCGHGQGGFQGRGAASWGGASRRFTRALSPGPSIPAARSAFGLLSCVAGAFRKWCREAQSSHCCLSMFLRTHGIEVKRSSVTAAGRSAGRLIKLF